MDIKPFGGGRLIPSNSYQGRQQLAPHSQKSTDKSAGFSHSWQPLPMDSREEHKE